MHQKNLAVTPGHRSAQSEAASYDAGSLQDRHDDYMNDDGTDDVASLTNSHNGFVLIPPIAHSPNEPLGAGAAAAVGIAGGDSSVGTPLSGGMASSSATTAPPHHRRAGSQQTTTTASGTTIAPSNAILTSHSTNHGATVFGPNFSALAMLKQLKFSPFVAARLRGEQQEAAAAADSGGSSAVGRGRAIGEADGFGRRRAPSSAWEYFTPGGVEVYTFVAYALSLLFFCSSIACIVERYKSKPDTPVKCDPRLDLSLSGLAGLQMPASIFIPVWMAMFNQYIYPPMHAASRVPLERTFQFYNHFVMFSTFLALLLLGIFGSSLYALAAAKSWNLVEHEACGSAFSAARGTAFAAAVSIGVAFVSHFIYWSYLNSKLDEQRGVVRPIPMPN